MAISKRTRATAPKAPTVEAEQIMIDGMSAGILTSEQEKQVKAQEREARKEANKRFREAVSQDSSTAAVDLFFKTFKIASLLFLCGCVKRSGCSAVNMFQFLFSAMFSQYSIYRMEQMHKLPTGISTSSISRFLSNPKVRWEHFLTLLSTAAYLFINPLTGDKHKKVFTADDSDYNRVLRNREPLCGGGKPNKKKKKARSHKGKRTELAAMKYDHARKVHSCGFRMLTLGFTDGTTFLPLGFSLIASQHSEKIKGAKDFDHLDKRSAAYKRRVLACSATMTVLISLIKRAQKYIGVEYICADRWFSNPTQIFELMRVTKLKVLSVLKHNKTTYIYEGKVMTIGQIFNEVKKRPGLSRYLSSAIIHVPSKGNKKDQDFDAKVVFVRNRAKRSEWIAIISTDTKLSEEDIIEYYALRWGTETYFYTTKMFLHLNDECHALSYDAITAHVTIVAARYIMLAIEQRKSKDKRTLGELVALIEAEVEEMTIGSALAIFERAVFDTLGSSLHLSEEDLIAFADALVLALPENIKRMLNRAYEYDDDEVDEPRRSRSKSSQKKGA